MVGNDIVDLDAAEKESNWRRAGFLEKVFTSNEQKEISNSKDTGLIAWLFWSMKESAYKIFVQENFRRMLAPLKFECRIHHYSGSEYRGEVRFEAKKYFTSSGITAGKICTLACSSNLSNKNFINGDIEFSGSVPDKDELLSTFFPDVSEYIKKPAEDLSVIKDEFNIPYLCFKGELLKSSASFSHHGRYGAYAAQFF